MSENDVVEYYAKRSFSYDGQKERTWQSPTGFQKDLIEEIIKQCSETEGPIIEFGVGTGRVASAVIERLGKTVVGMDVSSDMLNIAKRKAAEKGYADKLILLKGSMDRVPFVNSTFGFGMVISAFHYLPKQDKAAAELKRVLRKGAKLIVGDLIVHEKDSSSFFDKLEKATVPVHNTYHSLEERRSLFVKAGFTHIRDFTFSYNKKFESIIADKAAYFAEEQKKKFNSMIENAPSNIKNIYKIGDEEMCLYYGLSVFQV